MEERIRYLFKQYLENKCTRKEFDEFFAILRESAHDPLLKELIQKAYADTGQTSLTYVDEGGNLVLPEPDMYVAPSVEPVKEKKLHVGLAMAAVIFLLLVAAWWIYRLPDKHATPAAAALSKKATGRSEYKYLLLPDSTQVWLNAASTLEYPSAFGKNKREVFLSGEAYFDVKHADAIPFIIHTGEVSTTVLGTAFNIRAYPGAKETIVVSVNRGKVRVDVREKQQFTLAQGQQVKIAPLLKNNPVEARQSVVQEVAAWQQGNLAYDDELLETIIADLERVYDVRVKIASASVRQLRISTSFKRETGVEQALQIICRLTETQLKQVNGEYIIQ